MNSLTGAIIYLIAQLIFAASVLRWPYERVGLYQFDQFDQFDDPKGQNDTIAINTRFPATQYASPINGFPFPVSGELHWYRATLDRLIFLCGFRLLCG